MYLLPCGLCESEELFGFKVMDLLIRFRPKDHIVYREEDDGAFLFNPETGDLKYMNRSAKEIYLILNGQNDINQLALHLHNISPDANIKQIQEDIKTLLEQLEESGFISSLDSK